MKILQINASARSAGVNSTAIAGRIVERLQAAHPAAQVKPRDLALTPHPVQDEAAFGVPMYNFGVTVQLKNWIDAIARGMAQADADIAAALC